MNTQLLKEVREKVIAAVPEIQARAEKWASECGDQASNWKAYIEITLANVLRAIDRGNVSGRAISVDTDGWFQELLGGEPFEFLPSGIQWDLSLPLEDQSEEVIAFLHKILTNRA